MSGMRRWTIIPWLLLTMLEGLQQLWLQQKFENCGRRKNSDRSQQVEGAYKVLLLAVPVIEG